MPLKFNEQRSVWQASMEAPGLQLFKIRGSVSASIPANQLSDGDAFAPSHYPPIQRIEYFNYAR